MKVAFEKILELEKPKDNPNSPLCPSTDAIFVANIILKLSIVFLFKFIVSDIK